MKNLAISLKIDPYYAEVYETIGQIDEKTGQLEAAAQMYEKAFMVNPTLPGPIVELESAGRRLGRAAYVRQVFEKAYKRFPDNIEIFKALERLKQ